MRSTTLEDWINFSLKSRLFTESRCYIYWLGNLKQMLYTGLEACAWTHANRVVLCNLVIMRFFPLEGERKFDKPSFAKLTCMCLPVYSASSCEDVPQERAMRPHVLPCQDITISRVLALLPSTHQASSIDKDTIKERQFRPYQLSEGCVGTQEQKHASLHDLGY